MDYSEAEVRVALPLTCKISENVQYVYTGSWIIDIDPYSYNITSIRYVDEYDEAQAWLKEKLNGKDVELFRGNMVIADN